MPTYRITLMQTVTEAADVMVEADDQEAAENKALEIAQGIKPETYQSLDWKFVEVEGDMEVIAAEEWPPVKDDPFESLPEGVTRVNLEDPAELHNTLKNIWRPK